MMANVIGLEEAMPYPELFANAKGWQPDATYPALEALTAAWTGLSERFIARLKALTEADLDRKPPFPTPTDDGTLRGFLAFMAHHEAYTIGQIGYVRRLVGLEAMKYGMEERAGAVPV